MKKQTAVEWLVEQITNDKFVKASDQIEIIHQAKEMEKEQIEEAYLQGFTRLLGNRDEDLEQYYNETFKSE